MDRPQHGLRMQPIAIRIGDKGWPVGYLTPEGAAIGWERIKSKGLPPGAGLDPPGPLGRRRGEDPGGGPVTPAAAAGILRRRRAYLVDHVIGKRASNMPTRHEEQEIEALDVALSLLPTPTRVDPVTSREYAPGSPRQTQPQGDTHGRTPH